MQSFIRDFNVDFLFEANLTRKRMFMILIKISFRIANVYISMENNALNTWNL